MVDDVQFRPNCGLLFRWCPALGCLVHAGGYCADALRVGITLGPDFDSPVHRADISKQSKQHDGAVNVGRIIAAREEALASGL